MRRLALFAFITVAFCPPISMLLMLAYAAPTVRALTCGRQRP